MVAMPNYLPDPGRSAPAAEQRDFLRSLLRILRDESAYTLDRQFFWNDHRADMIRELARKLPGQTVSQRRANRKFEVQIEKRIGALNKRYHAARLRADYAYGIGELKNAISDDRIDRIERTYDLHAAKLGKLKQWETMVARRRAAVEKEKARSVLAKAKLRLLHVKKLSDLASVENVGSDAAARLDKQSKGGKRLAGWKKSVAARRRWIVKNFGS